jgi:hypothetical protein
MVVCAVAFLAGPLSASTLFDFNGTFPPSNDIENASAAFTISNCSGSGLTAACQLDILITNYVPNPANGLYGISGLSFNIGSLTTPGTLKASGGNAYVTNGSGGTVNSVDLSGASAVVTLTNSAPRWALGYNPGYTSCPTTAFCLTTQVGGSPNEFILGSGPYNAYNSSLQNHAPDLGGPINFEIDNFLGLSSDSTFTNAVMDFGGAGETLNGVDPPPVPEPGTLGIMGLGLIGLGLIARRR